MIFQGISMSLFQAKKLWSRMPAKGSGRRSLLEWPAEGYLFSAICPERGTGATLVMPAVSIEAGSRDHRAPQPGED
ncbi:MAG: hypothetical protein M3Z96_02730, partial [Pseudomonadota bacterium]|nr:hypothetical protein [Pseudomonadota bacterium]